MRADSGQFDSARSHGSGGKDVVLGDHSMDAMYGVGNLQSSPAMKTFYNKALLSTAGSDVSQDFHAVVRITASILLEMGKNPNPARTNRTRTRVLPRTEPKFFSYASTLADFVSIGDGRDPKILGSCFSFRFFDDKGLVIFGF